MGFSSYYIHCNLKNLGENKEKEMLLRQFTEPVAFLILLSYFVCYTSCLNLDQFLGERNKMLAEEDRQFLGGSLSLNALEKRVNSILMKAKTMEYDSAIATTDFIPAKHFFKAKSSMMQSRVYEIIRSMPKGKVLLFYMDLKSGFWYT